MEKAEEMVLKRLVRRVRDLVNASAWTSHL
jgi:hypothetical protein